MENLLNIGQLKIHTPNKDEVSRLLEAARRNLADAEVTAISTETRFDAAYKAIMQAALVALMASGFRPDTTRPGHHTTVLQSLAKTIGLPGDRLVILDTFRRKRNLSDYSGGWVDEVSTDNCIAAAKVLLREVETWLAGNRPELVYPSGGRMQAFDRGINSPATIMLSLRGGCKDLTGQRWA